MNQATFERDIVGGNLPAAVDFSASWCGPCQALAPEIDRIKNDYDGRARVVKIDVDDHPELASKYGVQSVPTTIFFSKGEELGSVVGNRPELIRETLDRITDQPFENRRPETRAATGRRPWGRLPVGVSRRHRRAQFESGGASSCSNDPAEVPSTNTP